VITGEVGAGKSTLVAHLMATIDPARLTAAQVVTSKLDGEEIVHVVAQAFGLMVEGHDKATALGAIESFLHEEARAGRRCLLIVDEAQNLSIEALEELRMLSNFQLGSHPLLQTLLLGQPEFRETLAGHPELEQLRQRVIASHHLQAMEPNEVQPYIEHRMKCVGWIGNPSFDQRVFAEIGEATSGLPRRINQITNRLLMLGAVEQRSRIDGAMLHQVLAELDSDGHFSTARSAPQAKPAEAAPVSSQPDSRPEPVESMPLAQIESALAERDAQITELQQAVIELANGAEATAERTDNELAERIALLDERFSSLEQGIASVDERIASLGDQSASLGEFSASVDERFASVNERIAAFDERISTLEGRLVEQDRTIRHTLTMLIEWIEGDGFQRAA